MTAPVLDAGDPDALDRAADILRRGGIVAAPTETVYGLAADASNGRAVARIFEAKGRPRFNPLIAHVDSLSHAAELISLSDAGMRLAEAFWPGPLSIVAPMRSAAAISELTRAGLDTLAVRWPDAPAMTGLVSRLGRAIAAPSANLSGAVSPTTAAHVAESLGGRIDLILDGGPCRVGIESTIVSLAGPRPVLLRPGGVERGAIEAVTGPLARPDKTAEPSAPGMLESHYATAVQLRLNAAGPLGEESWLGFGGDPDDVGEHSINLSPTGDLVEAAANLFSFLRMLDAHGRPIAVAPIPNRGLGEAINDRLRRAAARS